jgi:hypothetical protein
MYSSFTYFVRREKRAEEIEKRQFLIEREAGKAYMILLQVFTIISTE